MLFYGYLKDNIMEKISSRGIEVDQVKVEIIKKLSLMLNLKGIRSFLGHVGFYRHFIKDFSKVSIPLRIILVKKNDLNFDKDCLKSSMLIKKKLVTTPIIIVVN